MRKRLGWFAGLVIVALVATSTSSFASGNVNFLLGQKMLDNDWEPIEDQPEFGAQITVGKENWPVQIAVDVLGSSEEDDLFSGSDVTVEGTTTELDLGVRKIWGKKKAHPFVGVGAAFVQGKVDFEFVGDDDDTAVGYWADAGVFWRLGAKFNLGFDVRFSRAEISLFEELGEGDLEAGGEHVGILLGWGW